MSTVAATPSSDWKLAKVQQLAAAGPPAVALTVRLHGATTDSTVNKIDSLVTGLAVGDDVLVLSKQRYLILVSKLVDA